MSFYDTQRKGITPIFNKEFGSRGNPHEPIWTFYTQMLIYVREREREERNGLILLATICRKSKAGIFYLL